MSIQSSFLSADHDDDPYASSHAGERTLNRAIVTAEISGASKNILRSSRGFTPRISRLAAPPALGRFVARQG